MWLLVQIVFYTLIVTGVISNVVLMKLMVFKSRFDVYCRIGLALLSTATIGYLLSSVAQNFTPNASFFYILSAITLFISQDAFTIERIISIKYPDFHDTRRFKWIFFISLALILTVSIITAYMYITDTSWFKEAYGLSTQVLVLSNLPLIIYAQRLSRQMYRADVSRYNLTRKHQLFNSYEITRSFVFAILINYFIEAIVLIMTLVVFKKDIERLSEDSKADVMFIVQTLWNINHTVYPWSVILFHRGQRAQIKQSLFPCLHSDRKITSLDGKPIARHSTQNDHFQLMKVAWTTTGKI